MIRFSRLQRIIHWLMVLLILPLLGGGMLIYFLGFQGVTQLLGTELRDVLYTYHKTFGLIVLGLMLLRLFIRIELGKPDYDPPIPVQERLLSALVHYALYLSLIAMPVLGWLATDALDYPVQFFGWNLPQFISKDQAMGETLFAAHGWVGFTIIGLLVLHIGGALKHLFGPRDDVFLRMWPL